MNPAAMTPYGRALRAFLDGESDAEVLVVRDDGMQEALPIFPFFRKEDELSELERVALSLCRGRVLDIGAGAGALSLILQSRGLDVTAIDISPEAVKVAEQRGVGAISCADIFQFQGGPFDTLLMLCHGIGMVETIGGLDRFLHCARGLLAEDGQLVLDSLDIQITNDPVNLAYQRANRDAGRYLGEIRMQFEFRGRRGPVCGWLHVDPDTLRQHALDADWCYDTVYQDDQGNFLARVWTEPRLGPRPHIEQDRVV